MNNVSHETIWIINNVLIAGLTMTKKVNTIQDYTESKRKIWMFLSSLNVLCVVGNKISNT